MAAPTIQDGVITTTGINALASYVDSTRTGVTGRALRTTDSSTTTSEIAVERLDNVALLAGIVYEIRTGTLSPTSTVATDKIAALIRYNTSGTAVVGSTPLPGAYGVVASDTALVLSTVYVPTGNETLSILLTVARYSGTGNCKLLSTATDRQISFTVTQLGTDPGDTGVDL